MATTLGNRFLFVGGAGDDQIGWNYTERFGRIFTEEGISGFFRLHASHDNPADVKAGSMPSGDIIYTALHRQTPDVELDPEVWKVTTSILRALTNWPKKSGEQLNLAGYSYGSVLQAQVALELCRGRQEEGGRFRQSVKVDNLVLIGSPIPSTSNLFSNLMLLQSRNLIQQVIRYDITGDLTSNPGSAWTFVAAGVQNRDPNNIGAGPHFDLARPDDPSTPGIDEGMQANEEIRKLARLLRSKGVN